MYARPESTRADTFSAHILQVICLLKNVIWSNALAYFTRDLHVFQLGWQAHLRHQQVHANDEEVLDQRGKFK